MDVKISNESKELSVYETFKFKFRLSEKNLDKLKDSDSYPLNLYTKIQKCIKLKKKLANGKEWEESCKAIFEEIAETKCMFELIEEDEEEEDDK
jgi:hypothetical protein